MNKYEILGFDTFGSGRLDVRVQFNDGRIYRAAFVSTMYLEDELVDSRFVAVPGLLVLRKVNMDEVKAVLNQIASTGYFDHLIPEEGGGE